jgi:hypothetical protein
MQNEIMIFRRKEERGTYSLQHFDIIYHFGIIFIHHFGFLHHLYHNTTNGVVKWGTNKWDAIPLT